MELWLANLPVTPGRVQHGTRPVVIVSNDVANNFSPIVTAVPLTSNRKAATLPTHVCLRGYGLAATSIAKCEQVMALDKSCLIRRLGEVSDWYDRLASSTRWPSSSASSCRSTLRRKGGDNMATVFTNDEKREIEEKAKYILTAMDDIGKNGDAYCTDEQLFRASKTVRPSLTGQRYRTDKALLLQAGFLHQEGYHLYAKRTWDYEVTAAERLADILKDPALPVMEIPKELRAGDIPLSEQQREAVELALNSRLSVILGGAGSGKTTLIEAIARCFKDNADLFGGTVLAAPTGKAARNLTERTGIEARTVHGALGKSPDANFLDAVSWNCIGLVVVDEASMVSLEMLAGILNRVRRNCRVVLLGDPNQLLSVGAGNILSDLLTLGVPSICLQQQYRQSTDAAALCQNVVDFPKLNGEHELRWDDSFRLLPADDRAIPDLLCEEAARR